MRSVGDQMRGAVAAIQAGDFATARRIAEQVDRLQPGNPRVLQVLGLAQIQGGAPEIGYRTLERALVLSPRDATLRLNLAKAALQLGLHARVEEVSAPLGDVPAGLHLRALAQKEAGDLDKAIALFRRATTQASSDPQLLNNFGSALISAGRFDEARTILSRARAADPRSPHILLNLGRAALGADDPGTALTSFREAAALSPREGQVLLELGRSFVLLSCHEEALPLLTEAARRGLRDPELFTLIGSAYSALGPRDEAEKAYRMALALDPRSVKAHVNLGLLLEKENRIDALATLAAEADAKGIAGADMDFLQALVLQRRGGSAEALQLAKASEPAFVDSTIRDEFIGKLADQLGDHELAWESFARMNQAMSRKPEARQFNGTEHGAAVVARTARMTAEWAASWINHDATDAGLAPVMLGGFLRSGTTLLDTILMSHPSTHVREEEAMIARLEDAAGDIGTLPRMTAQQAGNLREVYFAELRRGGVVPEGAVLIDKNPLMTLRSAYIHRAFPDARFVFALRHPCDVVLSCFMQNLRVTSSTAGFLTLENTARFYDAVMSHWMRARELLPLDVHTVRYEDMVADLEGQLRPLLAFLGLEWDASLLDHQRTAKERGYIRTPSYAQVTEKLYSRSSGRWESYRKHMEPVLPVLQPWIDRFGYTL
jgi:Flp pilus assembly protein TadD